MLENNLDGLVSWAHDPSGSTCALVEYLADPNVTPLSVFSFGSLSLRLQFFPTLPPLFSRFDEEKKFISTLHEVCSAGTNVLPENLIRRLSQF